MCLQGQQHQLVAARCQLDCLSPEKRSKTDFKWFQGCLEMKNIISMFFLFSSHFLESTKAAKGLQDLEVSIFVQLYASIAVKLQKEILQSRRNESSRRVVESSHHQDLSNEAFPTHVGHESLAVAMPISDHPTIFITLIMRYYEVSISTNSCIRLECNNQHPSSHINSPGLQL